MKKLILLITVLVVTLPQMSFADGEVIWESETIGGLNKVEVSPLGEVLYNTNDSIIQVRSIEDGRIVDEIVFPNTTRLDHISITADGKYMAVSGQTKYVIIYDLQERREIKRITTIAYEREEYGKNVIYNATQWISSSISPDGTKITGIAAWGGTMTNFVVIDIASEEVLFEQRRITYDHFNQSDTFYKWHTAEFSPDGNYIVSQMEYREGSNTNAPDSVYIYDANTFEVYDVVLNSYNENNIFSFSHFKPLFTTGYGKSLILYNFEKMEPKIINLESNARNIVFSRNNDKMALQIGTTAPVIVDYQLGNVLDTILYIGLPQISTNTNNLIYFGINHNIALIKPDWNKITSSEDNENDIIISPNPTSGLVNITLDCLSPLIDYQVCNNTGQLMEKNTIENSSNKLIIDFSKYSAGIYFLTINCESKPLTYKIVREG